VFVTVNYEVCNTAIESYLNVIKRDCKQSANKSNHPN
jgi:diacylglycerol kinase